MIVGVRLEKVNVFRANEIIGAAAGVHRRHAAMHKCCVVNSAVQKVSGLSDGIPLKYFLSIGYRQ